MATGGQKKAWEALAKQFLIVYCLSMPTEQAPPIARSPRLGGEGEKTQATVSKEPCKMNVDPHRDNNAHHSEESHHLLSHERSIRRHSLHRSTSG